jgi:5-formyltetrahydrofolate cyclo-ligase
VGYALLKEEIRSRIWKLMEEANIASFPRPVYGRIPNFKGAEAAAINLSRTHEFIQAKTIKVNPDSPQRKVRKIALTQGKIVLVPTPRLRGEFHLLDPVKIPDHRTASTISGAMRLGRTVRSEEIPEVDLIVVGSVAVTESGDRVGKGEGYSELEYAILRELGKVKETTPVATTVHSSQIVDRIPVEPFDVSVDIVSTEARVIYTHRTRRNPEGIYVNFLTPHKIESTPYLKAYLAKRGNVRGSL